MKPGKGPRSMILNGGFVSILCPYLQGARAMMKTLAIGEARFGRRKGTWANAPDDRGRLTPDRERDRREGSSRAEMFSRAGAKCACMMTMRLTPTTRFKHQRPQTSHLRP